MQVTGEVQMQRRQALKMVAGAAVIDGHSLFGISPGSRTQLSQAHVQWVSEVLTRMQTIKPGMTREALYRVFTTEGGLVFSPYKRTFVNRDCPYFKVDVDFRAAVVVGATEPDEQRQDEKDDEKFLGGNGRDIIVKISTPYLQFSIMD